MTNLFHGSPSGGFVPLQNFNEYIADWDTSSVSTMYLMFYQASAFNQPLNSWDVSQVGTMFSMFYDSVAFNQDLCAWRDHFNSGGNSFAMFTNSGCPNQDDPVQDDQNWCAAQCAPTQSPTEQPTNVSLFEDCVKTNIDPGLWLKTLMVALYDKTPSTSNRPSNVRVPRLQKRSLLGSLTLHA